MTYAFLALAYLLGATPTSFWVGKAMHGIDLRDHGSGNLGATNALRVLGWRSALPVVLFDTLKGFVPTWLFADLAGAGFGWTLAYGAAAIVGHMFSLWVGFRGGKGMATSAGAFLAVAPAAVLINFGLWLALTFGTGYVSLASIVAAIALPPLIWLTPHEGGELLFWSAVPLAAFVVWKHRSNIGRLIRGEENRFRRGRLDAATRGEGASESPGASTPTVDAEAPS